MDLKVTCSVTNNYGHYRLIWHSYLIDDDLKKIYRYIQPGRGSGCDRVVEGAGHKAKRLVLQCINGVSSNPVEGKHKFDSLKI
jgi:hypothetical protein